MTHEELEAIEAREAAATPGPWVWEVNSVHNFVHLRTTHSGRYYVMDFVRWGMRGASPRFQVYERHEGRMDERGSKGMFRADKLTKSNPGKEHHEGWDDTIDNPDAEFIAHARQDVSALLAKVKRLNAEKERLTRERDAAIKDLRELSFYHHSPCKYCRDKETGTNDDPCCTCKNDKNYPIWEWRGVQE